MFQSKRDIALVAKSELARRLLLAVETEDQISLVFSDQNAALIQIKPLSSPGNSSLSGYSLVYSSTSEHILASGSFTNMQTLKRRLAQGLKASTKQPISKNMARAIGKISNFGIVLSVALVLLYLPNVYTWLGMQSTAQNSASLSDNNQKGIEQMARAMLNGAPPVDPNINPNAAGAITPGPSGSTSPVAERNNASPANVIPLKPGSFQQVDHPVSLDDGQSTKPNPASASNTPSTLPSPAASTTSPASVPPTVSSSNLPATTTAPATTPVPTVSQTNSYLSGAALHQRLDEIASVVSAGGGINDDMLKGLPPEIANQLREGVLQTQLALKLAQDIQDGKTVSEESLKKLSPTLVDQLRGLQKTYADLKASQQTMRSSADGVQQEMGAGDGVNTSTENPAAAPSPASSDTTTPHPAIPDHDRFGVSSVPTEDSWAGRVGKIEIPPPGGGDVNNWKDLNNFGIKVPGNR